MFATIYLPNFYLQAAIRHHPKLRAQPVALIDASEKKVAIIELNDAAEKAGITKGMTPSQALARCLHVVIRARERAQENVIAEILLHFHVLLRNSRNAKFMPKPESHHRLTPVIWRRIWPDRCCKSTKRRNFSRRCQSKRLRSREELVDRPLRGRVRL